MASMFARMTSQLLRRATTIHTDDAGRPTHSEQDVRIADGVITEVGRVDAADGEQIVDLDGSLLLPAAVEPHAHLDKAFLAERIDNSTGDLRGAIEAMRLAAGAMEVGDIAERAERAARLMAANGYVAVRTHVDTMSEGGLRNVDALAEVRNRVRDAIDVEIVAMAGWPVSGPPGAAHRTLLTEALDVGADVVGGCPHLEDDIASATEVLLQIATDHGRAVDLHTDETLDPSADGLEILADRVLGGFDLGATASHCVSLGQRSQAAQRTVAAKVAAGGIGVVALPFTNLFLQGRGIDPMPRGLTAVGALRAAGATVAAGADNLQDAFNPVGRACPFETAALMIMTTHVLPHDAWAMVSAEAAAVVGRRRGLIEPGDSADLLAVRATSVREAIALGPTERMVWRRGLRTA